MAREILTSDKVFAGGKAPGSKAVKVGNLIFVCGMRYVLCAFRYKPDPSAILQL